MILANLACDTSCLYGVSGECYDHYDEATSERYMTGWCVVPKSWFLDDRIKYFQLSFTC